MQAAASTGAATQADVLAVLAALPADLPPQTGALDEAGFAAWLALYRSGHDGLHRVVALMRARACPDLAAPRPGRGAGGHPPMVSPSAAMLNADALPRWSPR